ncbi:pre-mRNA polyadenylation factor fip1 [Spraguea lophii 42_110]|uniref:Pre-mRNA polyadenylation factor fip1 n=1 Tax=Spraguea lophii (strain 42_110) TaxID=1358809 RepID=S7WAM7_SPRLO|nr:pre-mRNA polyadenylation factor fip1 [Spraguea lophii 42_110]
MENKDFIVDLDESSSSSSNLQVIVEDQKPVQAIPQMPMIDGTKLFDFEIDNLEDKPWRKPGADITDYFNYGFDEVTWKLYCAKQKNIREEFKDYRSEKNRNDKEYDRRSRYYNRDYDRRDDRDHRRWEDKRYDRRDDRDYYKREDRRYDRRDDRDFKRGYRD